MEGFQLEWDIWGLLNTVQQPVGLAVYVSFRSFVHWHFWRGHILDILDHSGIFRQKVWLWLMGTMHPVQNARTFKSTSFQQPLIQSCPPNFHRFKHILSMFHRQLKYRSVRVLHGGSTACWAFGSGVPSLVPWMAHTPRFSSWLDPSTTKYIQFPIVSPLPCILSSALAAAETYWHWDVMPCDAGQFSYPPNWGDHSRGLLAWRLALYLRLWAAQQNHHPATKPFAAPWDEQPQSAESEKLGRALTSLAGCDMLRLEMCERWGQRPILINFIDFKPRDSEMLSHHAHTTHTDRYIIIYVILYIYMHIIQYHPKSSNPNNVK